MAIDPRTSDAKSLAGLMALDGTVKRVWEPHELAAVLKHQLSAPVGFDLGSLGPGLAAQVGTLADAHGLLLKSFADLFNHPHPPVELLNLTKDFAKACRNEEESALPHEIAMLLYYLSIAVADLRCDRHISDLDDGAERQGLDWFIQQPWVDESVRSILRQEEQVLIARAKSRADAP